MTNSKRILIWAITIILLGGAIWGMYQLAASSRIDVTGDINPVVDSDWQAGNKNANAVLMEYGDFQCPACAAYYPIVRELIDKNGSEFLFVSRNFPLPQHANAKSSAYAAGASGKQGKFWEMHNMLYENQNAWSAVANPENLYIGYAQSIGLNIDQFKIDIKSAEVKDKVEADKNSGIKAGVQATPTFLLNGKRIQPKSYEEFVTAIRQINESTPTPSVGASN